MLELWPHQAEAVEWLDGRAVGYLHVDMGGGKTRVVIEHIARRGFKKVLVVCPKSVGRVWVEELKKWWPAPRPVEPVDLTDGPVAARSKALESVGRDNLTRVVITNYDSFWREPLRKAILQAGFELVVYDEAHRLKSPGGRASLFAAYLRKVIPNRLALSGTPMPHSPLDIYAQFRALDPSIFGTSFVLFRSRYAVMVGGFGSVPQMVVGFKNLNELANKMGQITFHVGPERITRPQVLDVPRYCVLEPKARRAYSDMENELIAEVEAGTITAANALVKLLRLQQITSGVARTDDGRDVRVSSAKENLLADILEDIPEAEPVVVFCRFIADLEAVHTVGNRLGRRVCELSGRRDELATWQSGGAPILAVQYRAGSLGISLTRARYGIFYSLSWSLGEYQQARARLVRPGQTRPVTFFHLVAVDTIDEVMLRALEGKAEVIQAVVDYLKTKDAREVRPDAGKRL
jgi:SNF2 family DNA or RNA helicase